MRFFGTTGAFSGYSSGTGATACGFRLRSWGGK